MTANILVTRPNRKGDPTSYTYQWGGDAVKIMKSLGYNVFDIRGDDVTYDNVTSAIRIMRPRLYLHVGHGCPTALVGQNECIVTRRFGLDELLSMKNFPEIVQPLKYKTGCKYMCTGLAPGGLNGVRGGFGGGDICNPICTYDTNIGLLRDTIDVTIACYSASQLGKCAIKYGSDVYVGYKDLMLFPVDSMKSEDIFKEVHLVFIRELLEGKSIAEAEASMNRFEDYMISIYKKTKYVSLPLLWNKLNRKVLGDKNARIYL